MELNLTSHPYEVKKRPSEVARFLRQFETDDRHDVTNQLLAMGLRTYAAATSATTDWGSSAALRTVPEHKLPISPSSATTPALSARIAHKPNREGATNTGLVGKEGVESKDTLNSMQSHIRPKSLQPSPAAAPMATTSYSYEAATTKVHSHRYEFSSQYDEKLTEKVATRRKGTDGEESEISFVGHGIRQTAIPRRLVTTTNGADERGGDRKTVYAGAEDTARLSPFETAKRGVAPRNNRPLSPATRQIVITPRGLSEDTVVTIGSPTSASPSASASISLSSATRLSRSTTTVTSHSRTHSVTNKNNHNNGNTIKNSGAVGGPSKIFVANTATSNMMRGYNKNSNSAAPQMARPATMLRRSSVSDLRRNSTSENTYGSTPSTAMRTPSAPLARNSQQQRQEQDASRPAAAHRMASSSLKSISSTTRTANYQSVPDTEGRRNRSAAVPSTPIPRATSSSRRPFTHRSSPTNAEGSILHLFPPLNPSGLNRDSGSGERAATRGRGEEREQRQDHRLSSRALGHGGASPPPPTARKGSPFSNVGTRHTSPPSSIHRNTDRNRIYTSTHEYTHQPPTSPPYRRLSPNVEEHHHHQRGNVHTSGTHQRKTNNNMRGDIDEEEEGGAEQLLEVTSSSISTFFVDHSRHPRNDLEPITRAEAFDVRSDIRARREFARHRYGHFDGPEFIFVGHDVERVSAKKQKRQEVAVGHDLVQEQNVEDEDCDENEEHDDLHHSAHSADHPRPLINKTSELPSADSSINVTLKGERREKDFVIENEAASRDEDEDEEEVISNQTTELDRDNQNKGPLLDLKAIRNELDYFDQNVIDAAGVKEDEEEETDSRDVVESLVVMKDVFDENQHPENEQNEEEEEEVDERQDESQHLCSSSREASQPPEQDEEVVVGRGTSQSSFGSDNKGVDDVNGMNSLESSASYSSDQREEERIDDDDDDDERISKETSASTNSDSPQHGSAVDDAGEKGEQQSSSSSASGPGNALHFEKAEHRTSAVAEEEERRVHADEEEISLFSTPIHPPKEVDDEEEGEGEDELTDEPQLCVPPPVDSAEEPSGISTAVCVHVQPRSVSMCDQCCGTEDLPHSLHDEHSHYTCSAAVGTMTTPIESIDVDELPEEKEVSEVGVLAIPSTEERGAQVTSADEEQLDPEPQEQHCTCDVAVEALLLVAPAPPPATHERSTSVCDIINPPPSPPPSTHDCCTQVEPEPVPTRVMGTITEHEAEEAAEKRLWQERTAHVVEQAVEEAHATRDAYETERENRRLARLRPSASQTDEAPRCDDRGSQCDQVTSRTAGTQYECALRMAVEEERLSIDESDEVYTRSEGGEAEKGVHNDDVHDTATNGGGAKEENREVTPTPSSSSSSSLKLQAKKASPLTLQPIAGGANTEEEEEEQDLSEVEVISKAMDVSLPEKQLPEQQQQETRTSVTVHAPPPPLPQQLLAVTSTILRKVTEHRFVAEFSDNETNSSINTNTTTTEEEDEESNDDRSATDTSSVGAPRVHHYEVTSEVFTGRNDGGGGGGGNSRIDMMAIANLYPARMMDSRLSGGRVGGWAVENAVSDGSYSLLARDGDGNESMIRMFGPEAVHFVKEVIVATRGERLSMDELSSKLPSRCEAALHHPSFPNLYRSLLVHYHLSAE